MYLQQKLDRKASCKNLLLHFIHILADSEDKITVADSSGDKGTLNKIL